jgi:uncharacterized protein
MDRIREYGHKCQVLRQIMSNKANRYRKINDIQNASTVVLTSFLGFIAFSGTDKVQTYLNWIFVTSKPDKPQAEFAFNVLVFGLFVLATLHLVFHFGKKQTDAEQAIVNLTNIANHIDDLLSKEEQSLITLTNTDLEGVRQRYDAIIQVIPPNSDDEFLRAKKDFQEKERRQTLLAMSPQAIFDKSKQIQTLKTLILRSDSVMSILQALRHTGAEFYLGGGLIRNLVWDYLHGFKNPTPVDDVDVIYFNLLSSTKEHDLQIEGRLRGQIQNLTWSVKNQARMHTANGDTQYLSVKDAVSKWPETATAIAVRLTQDGEVEVVAPHGLSDLFRLLIRPTPHFSARPDRVAQRVATKHWQTTWPMVEVLIPPKP